MRQGLTEAEVEAALGDLDTADLPAPSVAALRLADLLTGVRPEVDEAVYTDLRRHFDEDQILELGAALAVASGWQRFIEAFGIRPDSWTDATPLPWHGGLGKSRGSQAACGSSRSLRSVANLEY